MSLKLPIQSSCEIDDLMSALIFVSEKSWDEVESILMEVGLYPESTKTYFTNQFGHILCENKEGNEWLEDALSVILKEYNINGLYITHPI